MSVMSYLAERHGIQSGALIPVGKGESELLDPTHPMSSVNRRVRVKHLGGG
jgi:flagellar motor protein MotB